MSIPSSLSKLASRCPECPYESPRNMGNHLFFVHGYSKDRITAWREQYKIRLYAIPDLFECRVCNKAYKRAASCKAHERKMHPQRVATTRHKCVECPLYGCNYAFSSLLELCVHAASIHGDFGDFRVKEQRFANLGLFDVWRDYIEKQTECAFVIDSVNNCGADGTTLKYLRCSMAETSSKRRRRLKKERKERELNGLPEPGTMIAPVLSDHEGEGAESPTKGDIAEESNDEEIELDVVNVAGTSKARREAMLNKKITVVPNDALAKDEKSEDHLVPEDELTFEDDVDDCENKIQKHCTAHMRVVITRSGVVQVEYCEGHLGHDVRRRWERGHDPIPGPLHYKDKPRFKEEFFAPTETVVRDAKLLEAASLRRTARKASERLLNDVKRRKTEETMFQQLCQVYDGIGANVEVLEEVVEEQLTPVET